jgi:hypothetical protein
MAIGAGGGIMAGPMGDPMGNQPVAAPPMTNEPILSDTGEDMATAQVRDTVADTGRLAQAVANVSPDAKQSLLGITKGQREAMTQVLANLGITPDEANAVFDNNQIGIESGLIIPTEDVLSDPEGTKAKIDQFVLAMANKSDEGMMATNVPSGTEEATMDRRPAPAMV